MLPALERALTQKAVPYRVEGGSLIYRTQEVRDLLNCLAAIEDPSDQIALFGALRSPAFACSDLELARFKAAGGRFDYLRPGVEGTDGRVAEAMRTLARYHESRHSQSLAGLIESFVSECGQVESGILDTGERNSFRRARFLVEQARAFEAAGPESLRALISWLERRANEVIVDNEGAGLDDDEDAVRVLTIHAAKGLEFPIVFLSGMGSQRREPGETYMVDGANRRPAICIGSTTRRFELGDVEELKHLELEHSAAEFVRMLYVAATRARDHLIFSLFHKQSASRSGAAILLSHGAAESVYALQPVAPGAARRLDSLDGLPLDLPAARTVDEFEAGRAQLLAQSRQERYTSATAEVRTQAERKDETKDVTEPWSRGRGATRIGRAVHATLQSVGLDASDEMVMNFARAQAAAEAVPDEAAKIARLVRAALASKAAERARTAKRALREVPFALRLDGTTVEGFVDLVIEDGDGGLEIVDWKTDDVPAADVLARLADYRLQAGLYGLGLSQATGRPVTRLTYVFAASGVEESPGDPQELIEAAVQHLRTSAEARLDV